MKNLLWCWKEFCKVYITSWSQNYLQSGANCAQSRCSAQSCLACFSNLLGFEKKLSCNYRPHGINGDPGQKYIVYNIKWSSTWVKSPPGVRFYAFRERLCDLLNLGGDFTFKGGDFCRLKHTRILNWFQRKQYFLLGIKVFDALSTPWFITKVMTRYRTGHVIIVLTCLCVTLHCTNYPRSLRLPPAGNQAFRFLRRLWMFRCFDESNVQNKMKQ